MDQKQETDFYNYFFKARKKHTEIPEKSLNILQKTKAKEPHLTSFV